MDSVPATVPAVTASPGDPELLGPLSVLYAALIAKLLEVTVPTPGRGRGCGWRVDQCWAECVSRATVPERGTRLRCGRLRLLAGFSRSTVYVEASFPGGTAGGGASIIISR